MEQDFSIIPVKREKSNTSEGIPFFSKNFQWKSTFHLIYHRNNRFFRTKGKRPRSPGWSIIIHQTFSLARDWSKRVTWANISQLKLGNIPQFLKPTDNKHNSLNLAAKICSDICPWTLSVPRSSQFSSSFALGKLFASRNR